VIEDARRFGNGRELAAYVGLTPSVHNSGGRERLGSISKRGDKMLRTLLVEAAHVLLRRTRKPSSLQASGRQLHSDRHEQGGCRTGEKALRGPVGDVDTRDGLQRDHLNQGEHEPAPGQQGLLDDADG
jgi:hypothetical protein